MSTEVDSKVRRETAENIDIRFRFVEEPQRLALEGLLQHTRAVMQIAAFANVTSFQYGTPTVINRRIASHRVEAMGGLGLRKVSYQSPLEIVVMGIATVTAFRLIRLGERIADLRDRWATSKAHVARSEMEAAYYKMLEEQIQIQDAGDRSRSRYLKDIQPLTEQVAKALVDVESIDEQPEVP